MNYWWLNANPSEQMWKVYTSPTGDDELKDGASSVPEFLFSPKPTEWLSGYFSRANHSEVADGDIVICYKTAAVQKIVAIGQIRHVHRKDGKVKGCYIEVIKKIQNPTISKDALAKDYPDLNINSKSFAPATMYKLPSNTGLSLIGIICIKEIRND